MSLKSKIKESFLHTGNAVIDRSGTHTYTDLCRYCNTIVDFLQKNGVEKLAICLDQSYEAYAWILSAYLAEAEYLPLCPDHPMERKRYCINIYKPDLIVGNVQENEFADISFATPDLSCVVLKDIPKQKHSGNPNIYTLFTSGSTGTPKAVTVSRHTLENFIDFGTNEYHVGKNDVCSQYSALTFDLSVFDIFIALSNGACLVSFQTKISKLMPLQLIKTHKITYWHSVPNVIRLFEKTVRGAEDLESVRVFNFAGETLYSSEVEILFSLNRSCLIYNVFGHTETTFCMYQRISLDDYTQFSDGTSVSIGRTIPGYSYAIRNFDSSSNMGELIIIGDEIAEGYLGGDERCAFNTVIIGDKKMRYFVSGDYVYLKNGSLFFAGRCDDLCKVRGYRIDTKEIDNVLLALGVSVCTVCKNGTLHTFVIGERTDVAEQKLYAYLQEKLPDYYIPDEIIFIKEFPLNNSGKINKKALIKLI